MRISGSVNPAFRDFGERSARVEEVLNACRRRGVFVTLKGRRDECLLCELYSLEPQESTSFSNVQEPLYSQEPLLKMDRCATCLFGICNYGVGTNGYVNDPEKDPCTWLQKRRPSKHRLGGGIICAFKYYMNVEL